LPLISRTLKASSAEPIAFTNSQAILMAAATKPVVLDTTGLRRDRIDVQVRQECAASQPALTCTTAARRAICHYGSITLCDQSFDGASVATSRLVRLDKASQLRHLLLFGIEFCRPWAGWWR
jgi:hypothetical protein